MKAFGSKCDMIKNGCFHELDAFMMHGSPTTCTDVKCLADQSFKVTFHGKRAHAKNWLRNRTRCPLVAFNGIEFSKSMCADDAHALYRSRASGPANVVPVKSVGSSPLRFLPPRKS